MNADEIVIANLTPPLVARYLGAWKPQGPGRPDALELTWTVALGETQLTIVDGNTGKPSPAPLDGLEAVGWVKPVVNEVSPSCVELSFDVRGNALARIRWRLDKVRCLIEQWVNVD